MTYYKIINGVKYDKQLLDTAEGLTSGRGDGRISELEAASLANLAQDNRVITDIELATLYYIRHNFKFTAKAAAWFDAKFPPHSSSDIQQIIHKIVAEEFNLPGLQTFIDAQEATTQNNLLHNKISFETALRNSIHSFLKDGSHIESPRDLVANVHELFREKFDSEEAWDAALTSKVHEYLSENSQLALHPLRSLTDDEDLLAAPENRETPQENWIFQLALRNLSDHLYWAITDRTGVKPTYNYGFN